MKIENIDKDLDDRQNEINKLFSRLSPEHTFYVFALAIIGIFGISSYFLMINQNNPDIQKQILSMILVALSGGAGGYYGAKSVN